VDVHRSPFVLVAKVRQHEVKAREHDEIDFALKFRCELGPGSYSITIALTEADTHLQKNFEWLDNSIIFDVVNTDRPYFIGLTALPAEFRLARPRTNETGK
jgi:lipopolysaccharide transport system ATP-binding protein